MRRLLLATVLGLGLTLPAFAQTSGPANKKTPIRLADSLAVAAPTKSVTLTVGADRVKLPPDVPPPETGATVAEVAAAYDRLRERFGRVVAIAPPTMVVLNTAPDAPNIYAGMPALDAFTLLAASLTEGQWQAMTSEQGLSVADLDTTPQQQMFAAILSHDGRLLVRPQYAAGETWDDKDKRDLTDQLPLAHLRIGQTIGLELPAKDQPGSEYPNVEIPPPLGAPRRYQVDERADHDNSADTDYGVVVRAVLPNAPKPGQLDLAAPALQKSVPLDGLKTVGDLMARIGSVTRTELYADPRLEEQRLTLAGPRAAPAADLLRALAFCVTGTFRRVGPACVLTDDLLGIGTRRQIWAEFEADADRLRHGPVTAASGLLYTRHSPRDLPWFDDPGVYSPEEIKAAGPQSLNTQEKFLPELQLPLSQLTPAQQDMVQRAVDQWNRQYTLQPVTTEGKVTIRPALSVQLLVPGLDTPVDLSLNHGGTDQGFLFQMPPDQIEALQKAQEEKLAQEHPEWAAQMAQMPPEASRADVWAWLHAAPRRAALIHPRTAKAVDADVAAAQKLGLTELWLDVFSGGVAHIPGSPLSPAKPLPPGENDILAEALARTKGTPLRVFPTLDLLFWGPAPPARDVDRNLLGETSAQASACWQQQKASFPAGYLMSEEMMSNAVVPDWPGVAVSPTSPDVQAALTALVRSVATRPGVAGLVWRGTDTPGYDLLPGGSDTSTLLLGYHVSARLGFLRRFHADPIDLYDVGHSGTRANTDLPNFASGSVLYRLHDAWVKYRQDAALAFLRTLYAAAVPPGTPSSRRMPLLVKQRRRGERQSDRPGHSFYSPGWYGSWDDPRLPPPTLHTTYEDVQPGQIPARAADEMIQARSQSRSVVMPMTDSRLEQLRQVLGRKQAGGVIRGAPAQGPPIPAFVLDLDDPSGEDTHSGADTHSATDPLTALAAEMARP